jgi:hypothetical protein
MDELGTNNGLLGKLQANITTPTIVNGGMTAQDVSSNTYSTVGYMVSPPPQQIETQLQRQAFVLGGIAAYPGATNVTMPTSICVTYRRRARRPRAGKPHCRLIVFD